MCSSLSLVQRAFRAVVSTADEPRDTVTDCMKEASRLVQGMWMRTSAMAPNVSSFAFDLTQDGAPADRGLRSAAGSGVAADSPRRHSTDLRTSARGSVL
jgi:hypothetical protein